MDLDGSPFTHQTLDISRLSMLVADVQALQRGPGFLRLSAVAVEEARMLPCPLVER